MSVRDFQERRKIERVIFSWPILIILVTLFFIALWGIYTTWQTKRALDHEVAQLQAEIKKAEMTRQQYESKREELETPEGVDREARARFNLKKPGEEVVIFVDDAPKVSQPKNRVVSIFSAVMGWFKNLFH